ncbi:MAG: TonB-dependent receptor [Bacteroidaceae bacterium]|nr:TonB-dependent receptor [Bacteroidaceae bacterium]
MKKFVVLACLIALMPMMALAQGTVKGKVIDSETKEELSFVNIAISPKGSTEIAGGVATDLSGNFVVEGLKYGSYTLTVSFVGYKTTTREFSVSRANPTAQFRSIPLSEDAQALKEVEITGIRSQMKFEIDKKVFNVDQAIAAAGGSASELLENIPSVEVDNEGTVSLRGSESVTVWINGKAQGLNSDNQGSILEQIPAESIERIEVITNPSAKYSPEGTVGIINIVLKRDRKAGYYGSLQAGSGIIQSGDDIGWGGGRAGANINYSSGILDAYAQLNYRAQRNTGYNTSYRENLDDAGNPVSFLDQTGRNHMAGDNYFGRAGLTWHPTENDDISFDVMGMKGGRRNSNTIDYESFFGTRDNRGALIYDRDRITSGNDDSHMFNFQLGYKHLWRTDHFLDLTVSRGRWQSDNHNIYDQTTRFPAQTVTSYQDQNSLIRNNYWEAQADYENKLSANRKIEAGYKGNFNRENTPVATFSDPARQNEIFGLYNRFNYNTANQAFYGTYSDKLWQKLGYQIGFRGEWYRVDAQSETKDAAGNLVLGQPIKKNIFHLFPSAFLSYELPNNNELQLNYTNRVRRPWGGQLNDFKNITDSTNISFGNPNLNPEYSQSFELNYMKTWEDHVLSISSYLRHSDDIMQRISYLSDNIMYSTSVNVAASNSAGVEIVGKNRFWSALDLTTTVNLFYYQQDGFRYTYTNHETGRSYDVTGNPTSSFSWNLRMIASVKLPQSWSGQLTGMYRSGRANAQGYSQPGYGVDLGVRKQFADNKWSIAVNARDLLDSRSWRNKTWGEGFYMESLGRWGGRRIMATLTYNFGNMKAKKKGRGEGEGEGGEGSDDSDDNRNGGGDFEDIGGGFGD